MIKISPSILACDFANLQSELARIEQGGADWAHIDVMDGEFVPNITIGPVVIKALRPHSGLVFDVHLMIDRPERYIKEFAAAGADIITIHYESTADPAAVLTDIRKLGCRAGISIKPATDPAVLEPLLGLCDLVLIMSVEPGFGGQSFMPDSLGRISRVREMAVRAGLDPDIEVDGGISPANSARVLAAGANVIVAGSAVFRADDIPAVIAALRKE